MAVRFRNHFWIDCVCAVSFANCLYSPLWRVLEGPAHRYFFPGSAALLVHFRDVLSEILITSVLLFSLKQVTGRLTALGPLWDAVSLLCVSVAFWSALSGVAPVTMNRADAQFLAYSSLGCVCVTLLWSRSRVFRLLGRNAAICVTLFGMLTCYRIWATAQLQLSADTLAISSNMFAQESRAAPNASSRRVRNGTPVIWIVFDELDQALTFPNDRQNPDLPNLSRFRLQSVHATAMLPANYRTVAAIPSMLTGQLLSVGTVTDPANSSNLIRAGKQRYWGQSATLFSELTGAGKSTAVLGWHNPYCSVLGQSVDRCFTVLGESLAIEPYLQRADWIQRHKSNLKEIIRGIPLLHALRQRIVANRRNLGIITGIDHSRERLTFNELEKRVDSFLSDSPDFVLLHFSVPHPPGIAITPEGIEGDYFDNLVLADQILGKVRATLERRGDWDKACVLVTGDHHLRVKLWTSELSARVLKATHGEEDARTVCMLKMPFQSDQYAYIRPFNAVLLHDLVKRLSLEKIQTPAAAIDWLSHSE